MVLWKYPTCQQLLGKEVRPVLKFNNENIITGYIKQLLAEFNLPKYRIYTAKQYSPELYKRVKALKACIAKDLNKDDETFKEALKELIALEDPDVNILPTVYRDDYPEYSIGERKESYPKQIFYAPYIKDGKIQEFVNGQWTDCRTKHVVRPLDGDKPHIGAQFLPKYYHYNKPELNYTKNLQIKNNIYDSYTHEYLGDYLRFQRDYNKINLMPLYNCFSNRDCEHLDLSVEVSSGNNGYTAEFKTSEDYKIYMVPVKLFQKYTIAIDCEGAVEMCCGLYDKYQYKDTSDTLLTNCMTKLAKATYTCYNSLQFKTPVLFDKLFFIKSALYSHNNDTLNRIAAKETALKLFIKVPKNNKSSIVVLEGDYTSYNDMVVQQKVIPMEVTNRLVAEYLENNPEVVEANEELFKYLIKPFADIVSDSTNATHIARAKEIINGFPLAALNFYRSDETLPGTTKLSADQLDVLEEMAELVHMNAGESLKNEEIKAISQGMSLMPINAIARNRTIINFEEDHFEELTTKLISPLQLLRTNTGTSYPFADRLLEYLVGNAITQHDEISDNISRAKSVAKVNCEMSGVDLSTPGIWSPIMQLLFYNYIAEKYSTNDAFHDLLGFVDKDVERLYKIERQSARTTDVNGNRQTKGTTISQINIYSEWED